MGALPVVTTSASLVELGKPLVSGASRMGQEQKEQRAAPFSSKSDTWNAWNDPMILIQSVSSRKVGKPGSRSFKSRKDGQELHAQRPSKWMKFWRKLRFDSGKRVHAARPDWLNYDSQSYSMNFEKDIESSNFTTQDMPKISGPGAREIVTVLLTRSPTTKRNSGAILIPKPVSSNVKQESRQPLWERRNINAPPCLDVTMRQSSMKRRLSAAA